MEKEFGVAIEMTKAYKEAQEHGILAIEKINYNYSEIKSLLDIMLECINKDIQIDNIYEILQNYGEDIENKKVCKLIVNGLICIIAGQNVQYFIELSASILGVNKRKKYIEKAREILKIPDLNEQLLIKYTAKKAFSEKTDILDEVEWDVKKLKKALNMMNNKEMKIILIGVSGETARKLINLFNIHLLKYIDEEVIEELNEEIILDVERKFIYFLNEDK